MRGQTTLRSLGAGPWSAIPSPTLFTHSIQSLASTTACTQGPSSLVSEHCLFGNESIPTGTGVRELVQRDSTRPGLTPHCHEVRTRVLSDNFSVCPDSVHLAARSDEPLPRHERDRAAQGLAGQHAVSELSRRCSVLHSLAPALLFCCPRAGCTLPCTSRYLSDSPSGLPLCIAPQRLRPRTESPKTPSTLAIIWPCAPKSASRVTGTCPPWERLSTCLVVYEIGNPASKALGCVTLPG